MAKMLAVKSSAGVAPEVNLRNSLHAGKEVGKTGSNITLKLREDVTRYPKQGYE